MSEAMASSRTNTGRKLDDCIRQATDAMLARQQGDGHWVFELEADCTIPAQYVLAHHFIGEPLPAALEEKFAVYLRRIQGAHGGWPLFHDGDLDVSASVTAYLALKAIGDSPAADHMRRAREAILARGGAAASNVFTRFLLALFGVVTWRAVPVMPVEIMLLPQWFPFHLSTRSLTGRAPLSCQCWFCRRSRRERAIPEMSRSTNCSSIRRGRWARRTRRRIRRRRGFCSFASSTFCCALVSHSSPCACANAPSTR